MMLVWKYKKSFLMLALCLIGVSTISHAAKKNKPPQSVKDLYFGVGLFEYFQQNYFEAITALRAAQLKRRIKHHAEDTELLIGGMYMDYGMYLQAQKIFNSLLDQKAAPRVRDQAWFLLGKGLYEHGFLNQARDALVKQGQTLDTRADSQRRVLLANLIMQQKHFAAADSVLRDAKDDGIWGVYAAYNRGVAKMNIQKFGEGTKLLNKVGTLKVEQNNELRSIRDKANLALGFHYGNQKPDLAKRYFERVRLRGLLSNRALLGIGWSYLELNDYQAALVPWLELSKRDIHDPAVLEVYLAIPAAYHKLNAFKEALDQYQSSIEMYKSEIKQIEAAIKSVNAGRVLKLLVEDDDKQGLAAKVKLKTLPHTIENHYLIQLMAGHHFQAALQGYLKIRFLRRNLQHRLRDIEVFDNILEFRRNAYRSRLPSIMKRYNALNIAAMGKIRDEFAQQISRVAHAGMDTSLASLKQKQTLAKLNNLERQRASMAKRHDMKQQGKLIRLMRGKLLWDIYTEFPERLNSAKKKLYQLDDELAKSKKLSRELITARETAQANMGQFQARINQQRNNLLKLEKSLPALANRYENYIASLAASELKKQLKRLDIYLTQAQLGVAQIYDRAREKQGSKP